MTRTLAALVCAAALLTGCGNSKHLSGASAGGGVESPTPTPTPAAGPAAFLADIRRVGFGDKETEGYDTKWLNVGNQACMGMQTGLSYGQAVQAYLETPAKPTQEQAETMARSAIKNLCPEYAAKLPPQ
jgi:hypothetical protein